MLPEGALKPDDKTERSEAEGGAYVCCRPLLGERSESLRGEAPAAHAAGGGAEPQ